MQPAPRATLVSTCVTVMANLVGAGLLSLPYTLKRAGLATGAVAMVLMCVLNACSLLVIVRCCELSKQYSYKDIGKAALGATAATFMTAIMAVYTMGSCVSFVVLIGDFLPSLVCENGCDSGPTAFFGQRWVMVCLAAALALLPLSLMRDLSSLRFTSALSFFCIVYTALMIGVRALRGPTVPLSELNITGGSTGLFVSLPITMVAFTLHYNAPRYYFELSNRSIPRFGAVTLASFLIVLVMYLATALGGYLLFGPDTKGDVLSNFADGDSPALVARIALSCIVISCYPLAFNSLRGSVSALLPEGWRRQLLPPAQRGAASPSSVQSALSGSSEEDHLSQSLLIMGGGGGGGEGKQGLKPELRDSGWALAEGAVTGRGVISSSSTLAAMCRRGATDLPHAALTLLLVLVSVGVGLGIPEIAVVLGYKGALGGSLIVFVFPALMHFSLMEQHAQRKAKAAGGGKGASGASLSFGEEGEMEGEEGADETAPVLRGKGASAGASVWSTRAVFRTPHGWLMVGAVAWGACIAVLGTSATAGLLS